MHSREIAVAALAALLACEGAAPSPSPPPSASASPASPPAPPASTASLPPLPPASTVAPPLSPRRAANLAIDVEDHIAMTRVAWEHPARVETVGDLFILAPGDPAAPFDAAVSVAQRTVDALYAGPLAHRPDKAVVVWVYSSKSAFERGIALRKMPLNEPPGLGLYDPSRSLILTWTDAAGTGSLAHEIAHPLVSADFPRAPVWLLEGLPALLEVPDFSHPPAVHGKAHFRLQTLRDTLAGKDAALASSIRLDALFAMVDDASFREAPLYVHYACAREALRWLDDIGKLWPWYRAFRENALEDPRGIAAFTRIVGKSPADATAGWLAWIQSDAAEGPTP
jgi:hypothetical protein